MWSIRHNNNNNNNCSFGIAAKDGLIQLIVASRFKNTPLPQVFSTIDFLSDSALADHCARLQIIYLLSRL